MTDIKSEQYNVINFDNPDYPVLVNCSSVAVITDPNRLVRIFHEEIEIKRIHKGSATLMIDGELHTVHPGDIVIVNPYEFHYTTAVGAENAEYSLYTHSVDVFKKEIPSGPDLRQLLLGDRICFKNIIHDDNRLQRILTRIDTEMLEKKDYWRLVVSQLFTEFYVILLREYVNTEKTNSVKLEHLRYYEIVAPALSYIHAHYEEKLTVDMLSKICCISKDYLHHIFKQVTGFSVTDYTIRYRLKLADNMLAKRNTSVERVAQKCGFSSVQYFCKCYKKVYGKTAKQKSSAPSPFSDVIVHDRTNK